jgi:myo-inositol-1(or 4)-monophosphatase
MILGGKQREGLRSLIRRAGVEASRAAARRSSIGRAEKAGPLDPVTEADLAIEALLRDELSTLFPHDRFWGEEGGMPSVPSSGRVWICDPIDGTRSFLRFGHDFCLSLGLLVDGEIVFGMIFDPQRDDLYEAQRGHRACLNGKPLRVAPLPSLAHALIGLGYSERVDPDRHADMVRDILREGAMLHQHGSGALALAQVAAGRLDAYVELHQNAWDALAGLLIAEEAGAKCLSWSDLDLLQGTTTLAANPGIAEVLARIARGSKNPEWGITKLLRKENTAQQRQ